MQYNLEQLIKALAAETLTETSNEVDDDEHEDNVDDNISNLAEKLIREIDNKNINEMSDMIENYSYEPMASILLNTIERIASQEMGKDPRYYTSIIVKRMDTPAALYWYNNVRKYK